MMIDNDELRVSNHNQWCHQRAFSICTDWLVTHVMLILVDHGKVWLFLDDSPFENMMAMIVSCWTRDIAENLISGRPEMMGYPLVIDGFQSKTLRCGYHHSNDWQCLAAFCLVHRWHRSSTSCQPHSELRNSEHFPTPSAFTRWTPHPTSLTGAATERLISYGRNDSSVL